MAHFIGYVQGARGMESRTGTRNSGMSARAQGWNIGGAVRCFERDGQDFVCFEVNHGSNGSGNTTTVAVYRVGDNGALVRVHADGDDVPNVVKETLRLKEDHAPRTSHRRVSCPIR